jgi:hypothetical protein
MENEMPFTRQSSLVKEVNVIDVGYAARYAAKRDSKPSCSAVGVRTYSTPVAVF